MNELDTDQTTDQTTEYGLMYCEGEIPTTLPLSIIIDEDPGLSMDQIKVLVLIIGLSFLGLLLIIWITMVCHRGIVMLNFLLGI